jgi:hypothetical protein
VPKKKRQKYGKRRVMTEESRLELCRDRNKEHARSTRKRRRIFETMLRNQIRAIQDELSEVLKGSKSQLMKVNKSKRWFWLKQIVSEMVCHVYALVYVLKYWYSYELFSCFQTCEADNSSTQSNPLAHIEGIVASEGTADAIKTQTCHWISPKAAMSNIVALISGHSSLKLFPDLAMLSYQLQLGDIEVAQGDQLICSYSVIVTAPNSLIPIQLPGLSISAKFHDVFPAENSIGRLDGLISIFLDANAVAKKLSEQLI